MRKSNISKTNFSLLIMFTNGKKNTPYIFCGDKKFVSKNKIFFI